MDEFLDKRKKYYEFIPALFEIVKNLQHRELAFLTPSKYLPRKTIRYMFAERIDYLKSHFEAFDFYKHPVNMYMSVAVLKNIPIFTYNLKERIKSDEYKIFNKEYEINTVGYNFFMDFDGKEDYDRCLLEVKEMKKILDEYKVPYYVMPSSFRGFHFHIPYEYMPDIDINETLKVLNKVVYNIKGIHDFKTLDITIVDMKRICKVPYSVVSDGSVCLPLNDMQFNNFRKDMIEIDNVLKNITLKNRGLLLRTNGLTFEGMKYNVKKFISDYT